MGINIGGLIDQVFAGGPIAEMYAGRDLVWQSAPRAKMDYVFGNAENEPYRIMFMGSSTMQGHGVEWPEGFAAQLVAHIVSHLPGVDASPMVKKTNGTHSAPTAPGFHFLNAAVGGTNANNYFGPDRDKLNQSFKPHLVIHMVGSNDYSLQRDPEDYRADIDTVLNSIKRNGQDGVKQLFIHQCRRQDVDDSEADYDWSDYGDILREIGNETANCEWLDADKMFTRATKDLGEMWQSDSVHLNRDGNTALADCVAEFLPLETHDGELIYGWNLLDTDLSDGTRLTRKGPTDDSMVSLPLEGSGNGRPVISNRDGVLSANFHDGNMKLETEPWGGAYALPITMIIAVRTFNDDLSGSSKPIFTRSQASDDGYIWAWRNSDDSTMNGAVSSAFAPGVNIPRSELNKPTVVAVTFLPNGVARLRVGPEVYESFNMPSDRYDSSNGPWMKSLKLMTNTGNNQWGRADVYSFYLYKTGDGDKVIELMKSVGDDHGIMVRRRKPRYLRLSVADDTKIGSGFDRDWYMGDPTLIDDWKQGDDGEWHVSFSAPVVTDMSVKELDGDSETIEAGDAIDPGIFVRSTSYGVSVYDFDEVT